MYCTKRFAFGFMLSMKPIDLPAREVSRGASVTGAAARSPTGLTSFTVLADMGAYVLLRYPGDGRHFLNFADDFHDSRFVRRECLLQRTLDLAGFFDAHCSATHRLGDFRETEFGEELPHMVGTAARIVIVVALQRRILLAQCTIVVHEQHDVDVVTERGLELGHVVVDAAVTGETNNRLVGQR